MAGRKRQTTKVSLICPVGRPIVLRYWCPIAHRRVRRSTGTYDAREARKQAKMLEAELLTGTHSRPLETTWVEFRERYDAEELKVHLRKQGRRSANAALDQFEQIIKPDLLADAVTAETILRFRNAFAAGQGSRFGTRSPYTVASRMATLMAAFRWAESLGLIEAVPRIPRFRPGAKKKAMKGRPIAAEEFERMLEKTASVVGESAAASWKYLLRGLWESGLRLDEAMQISWDLPGTIQPLWRRGALPTVQIPGNRQKNAEDDEIPMLPAFEALLLETTEPCRTGWVFDPVSLQEKLGRSVRHSRPSSAWTSKVIVRIGEAAGVIVEPAKGVKPNDGKRSKTYQPPKYASAHDLRRSCADRLEAAGIDPMVIARIMRHKSYETTRRHYAGGNIQRDAGAIRSRLASEAISGHTSGHSLQEH